MSLRPIDIQTLLTHMNEVGKIEAERINKKNLIEISENRQITQKNLQKKEGITDVNETEKDSNIINDENKNSGNRRNRRDPREQEEKGEKDRSKYYREDFKGNFIDIKE
ncbi:MAG: hypothetical protein A2096_17405 [Spirochaetes bacterium GWF1_41_5]|nr:MAG: hypothetical protein A2096_17405 [Spirochaetes bacterium GWF1_41_5]